MNAINQYTESEFLTDIKEIIDDLDRPGVYFLYNHAGELVYVGKSKNLSQRVHTSIKKRDAHFIAFAYTKTSIDASIYEMHYINKHRPPLNVIHKDGKPSTVTLPELQITQRFKVGVEVEVEGTPEDFDAPFIIHVRKQKGWTQKDLADRLEIHWTVISRMENGKQKIDKRTELAIRWLERYS